MIRPGLAKGPSVGPSSSGGGTGDLSGTLNSPKIPVATGAHTLADTGGANANVGLTYTEPLGAGKPLVDLKGISSELSVTVAGLQDGNRNAGIIGKSSRGTIAAPAVVANGDGLVTLRGAGYDGATFGSGGGLSVVVDGAPGTGVPTKTYLFTCDDAGIERPGLTVDASQNTAIKQQLVVEKSSRRVPTTLSVVSGAVAINALAADSFLLVITADTAINAPTNPQTGRSFLLRIYMSGAISVLTWNAVYRFLDDTAPTFVRFDAYYYLGFIWNEIDSKWDCVGSIVGPFGGA